MITWFTITNLSENNRTAKIHGWNEITVKKKKIQQMVEIRWQYPTPTVVLVH